MKAVICDTSTRLQRPGCFSRGIPATARKKHSAKAYTVCVSHGMWSDTASLCDKLDVSLRVPYHFKTIHTPQNEKQKVCTTHHLTIQLYPKILITLYFVEYSFQHCAAWLSLAKLKGYPWPWRWPFKLLCKESTSTQQNQRMKVVCIISMLHKVSISIYSYSDMSMKQSMKEQNSGDC